jgi:uncharacterized protein YuzE
MPITAEYDQQADALYIRIAAGERRHAVEINDSTYVDVDTDARPLGLEFLYPSMGLNVQEVARRYQIQHLVPEIVRAIKASGAPVPLPTMTGGQLLASTSTVTVFVEGTVPAATSHTSPAVGHGDHYRQPLIAGPG